MAAPEAAIPIQGPALIANQPASEPVPASANSLQRGKELFARNCAMCHGPDGKNPGAVGALFNPTPPALVSEKVGALTDQQVFLILSRGLGRMPSMYETLSPIERWDVINHVRSLN
jgi:mono/diheme cytochrome c family protein